MKDLGGFHLMVTRHRVRQHGLEWEADGLGGRSWVPSACGFWDSGYCGEWCSLFELGDREARLYCGGEVRVVELEAFDEEGR